MILGEWIGRNALWLGIDLSVILADFGITSKDERKEEFLTRLFTSIRAWDESRNKMSTHLRKLMADRQVLLDEENDYYEKFTDEEIGSETITRKEDPRCEELRMDILNFIRYNHKKLTVEDILEGITSTGGAPCLLYDDNGHFAIGGSGFGNVLALETEGKGPKDRLDFQGTFFLKKENWKPTVREAFEDYFNRPEFGF